MQQILEIFLKSRMIQKGSEELREREFPPAKKLEVGHRLIDFVSPGTFRRFGDDRVS